MLSLSIKSSSGLIQLDDQSEFNFETIGEEWFNDIDEVSVCCSTPRNKLCIQAFYKSQEIPDFSACYNSICTSKDESKSTSFNQLIDSNICIENSKSSIDESKESKKIELLRNTAIALDVTYRRKTVDLSMRHDVINKASLRRMKKFYMDIFKQHNLKLVRARFCNAKSSEVLRAIKKTFEKDFETENLPADFYHYLIGILKARDISCAKCSRQIKMEVFEFLDCSRNYSKTKFEALFRSQCLRILCRRFLYQNIENEKYQLMLQEMEKYEAK